MQIIVYHSKARKTMCGMGTFCLIGMISLQLTIQNGESFLLKDISSKVITQLKTDLEASFAKAADYSLFSGNSMSGSELGWVAFKHRDYSVGVAFSANISTFPIFIRRNSTGEWSFSGK